MFNCEIPTTFTPRGAQTTINNCLEPRRENDCQRAKAQVANKHVLGPGGNKKQDLGRLNGYGNYPGRAS